jgi:hypothetical protein
LFFWIRHGRFGTNLSQKSFTSPYMKSANSRKCSGVIHNFHFVWFRTRSALLLHSFRRIVLNIYRLYKTQSPTGSSLAA